MKVDLAALRASKVKGNLYFVEIFVHKQLSETCFVVGDPQTNMLLDITNNPDQGKEFAPGKCFRLIKPKVENDILLVDSACKAGPIATFEVPQLSARAAQKFKLPSEAEMTLISFDEVCVVTQDTVAPALYLKVVFLSSEKRSKYSSFRTAKVRDVLGQRHFIQLFGDFRNAVVLNKVYKFVGLLIQKYKKPDEKWGRIRTQANTKILEASEEITERFSNLHIGDAKADGILFAHEQIYHYECCSACTKAKPKVPADKCPYCGLQYELVSASDFSVVLHIANSDIGDVLRVFAFRNQIGLPFKPYSKPEIQADLEKFHMQHCIVAYDDDKRSGLYIQAAQVTFTDSNEDSGMGN
jgi:RNA polymerase subunit RPABC4/transcription elongation factor Spt4